MVMVFMVLLLFPTTAEIVDTMIAESSPHHVDSLELIMRAIRPDRIEVDLTDLGK